MRTHIYALKEYINHRSEKIMRMSEESIVRSRYIVGVSLGLCALIAISMALLIPQFIIAPILNMQKFVYRLINEEGDLSQKIPTGYGDGLGALGATINELS
ncbi:MAG TPA: hypothetical protein VIZ65_03690 [Cellvibrionaceae bacterium]